MTIDAILYSLGMPALFSSRAFVPAFLSSLMLRFGHHLPLLADVELLQRTAQAPTWFTQDLTIVVLGILAALEIAATKIPEAQEALQQIDKYLKAIVAALVTLGVIGATDQAFIDSHLQQAGVLAGLFALVAGAITFQLAWLRSAFFGILIDSDEDDDLGIRGILSWIEDLWSALGVLLLLIYPIVMLILMGMAFGCLKAFKKYAEHREDQAKLACRKCGTKVYPCAVACQNCRTPLETPAAIGMLGQSKALPAQNPQEQSYRLAEKKRCPVCATRLKQREMHQTCPACGHELFADKDFCNEYVSRITARLPIVLVVCALLSLVPILGLIPGIIYYRFVLVGPFRRYLPLGKRFLLKWTIRILFFILIALQWIPAVGGVVVPLMAAISYGVYRASFVSRVPAS